MKHLLFSALAIVIGFSFISVQEAHAQCMGGGYEYRVVLGYYAAGAGETSYHGVDSTGNDITIVQTQSSEICPEPGGDGGGGGGELLFPDLTAGSISPQSATVSVAETFSTVVINQDAGTADPSTVSFYQATDAAGSGATSIGSDSIETVYGGASRITSFSHTFTSAGTFYLRACADSGDVVYEGNENNNCGPWTAVTVAPAEVLQPDLTATAASASGATYGGTGTISASIQNAGNTLAGASNGYYQLTAPSSKGNTSGTLSMSSIAASGSAPASFNYKFSYEGTYSVRFCADWYGEVAESNEANNCGPWTDIPVLPQTVSSSVSCSVSSSAVSIGQTVTYTAHPVNAATGPYSWSSPDGGGSYGTGITATRTFTANGTYRMEVSATNATNNPASCPVVLVTTCPGTPTADINADPTRVERGETVTLNWSASAINTSCTISGPGVNQVVTAVSCAIPDGTVVTSPISAQSTYTISCENGAVTDSVIVNVVPDFTEF